MLTTRLEHLNVTVKKPRRLAETLCRLFDWKIRWEGATIHSGYTVHVGENFSYLALYTPPEGSLKETPAEPYFLPCSLNHIGIETDKLDLLRERVLAEGLTIHSEREQPPGEGFYFMLDGLEFEVASY